MELIASCQTFGFKAKTNRMRDKIKLVRILHKEEPNVPTLVVWIRDEEKQGVKSCVKWKGKLSEGTLSGLASFGQGIQENVVNSR